MDGGWWLVSDNPSAGAVDSNRFGPVREDLIVGRVLARYWPGKPPHARGARDVVPRTSSVPGGGGDVAHSGGLELD